MTQNMSRDELMALIDQAAEEGWTKLDLAGNGLTELPPEIGKLTQLETLILGKQDFDQKGPEGQAGWKKEEGKWVPIVIGNGFTTLPNELEQLTKLKTLDISGYQWDSFPSVVVELSSLEKLSIVRCGFFKLPEIIVQLPNLTTLDLSGNQITEIPEIIAQLSNLTTLDLSGNLLAEVSESLAVITQLLNLKSLDLSVSAIAEIPEIMAQLSELTELNLSGNQITEIPSSIAQLTNLTTLSLSSNQIKEIPAAIAQLPNLTELYLSSNQIKEIPAAIAQLPNLTELYLSSNQIKEIPAAIAQLTNLTTLDLSSNQIKEIPAAIAALTNLTTLNLNSNQIKEIPAAIAALTNLTTLNLYSNQIKEIPAAIAALTNLTTLNLYSNQIKEIPAAIAELTNLTTLNLNSNQIKEIPAAIAELTNLTTLNLNSNQIKEIPAAIAELTNLTTLNLYSNQIKEIPAAIAALTNLTTLNLYSNQIKEIPAAIAELTNLTTLDLDSNQIKEIPAAIAALTNLTTLNLYSNQIKEIPAAIAQLTNLTTLDLDSNQIKEIPAAIAALTNLTTLNLNSNQIKEIPAAIAELTNLTTLNLNSNQIKEIPAAIAELTNLTTLYLDSNQIKEIPAAIETLPNLKSLRLRGNPLPIPTEILAHSKRERGRVLYPPEKLFSYLRELRSGEKRQLNEAKLLLIGQGSVGKTSLINRLIHDRYNPNESQTDGLKVSEWEIEVNTKPVRLNVWDFGGQEIYHATHQFFLTKRSLYILTCNCRTSEDENRIEYWLKLIQSFGGNSPVIIVGNKYDEQPLDINRKALRDKYPNIKAILETSCSTGHGINELKAKITHEVSQLSDVYNLLPLTWFEVKEQLEDLDKDFITYSEYSCLCHDQRVTEEQSKEQLIDLLHNLGLVLNFRDHPILKGTNVLNPDWVTTGIYALLSDEALKTKTKGILSYSDLSRILNPERYPVERHRYLTELIQEFQLGFPLPDTRPTKYLLPGLLPKDEPDNTRLEGDTLDFQYHYRILPESILSRFIVLTHEDIHEETYWRSGVMLRYEDNGETHNLARIKADPEDKKIFIAISGKAATRRTFLAMLRKTFNKIHSSFANPDVTEWVPVPDHPTHPPLDYQELLGLEKMGVQDYPIGKLGIRLNIRTLLDGYETLESRQPRHRDGIGKDGLPGDPGDHYHFYGDNPKFNQQKGNTQTMSNTINQYGDGDNIAGDKVLGDKINTQFNNSQNLAEAVRDIKALFAELDQSHDKTTPLGQSAITFETIKAIEGDPTLKKRLINAVKEGGAAAIEAAIDHPAVKPVVAAVKGYIDA